MKQATPTQSSGGVLQQSIRSDDDRNDAEKKIRHFVQDNRGRAAITTPNAAANSSSDLVNPNRTSSSSFASSSPWSRWIFSRSSVDCVNNSQSDRRLSITDGSDNKVYSVLSNCSSPTDSETSRRSANTIHASTESPVSLFHPTWIYENVPPPKPAPAIPDILEAASLASSYPITPGISSTSTSDEHLLRSAVVQRRRDCLAHCACRNPTNSMVMASAARSPSSHHEVNDQQHQQVKKTDESRLGFVDRARMVSFKRKKVAPTMALAGGSSTAGSALTSTNELGHPHYHDEEEGEAVCSQCTCFLDPVNLSPDAPGSLADSKSSSLDRGGSSETLPCSNRNYENTDNVLKTVILHTGFSLPQIDAGGHQDFMLAMDSPRVKKADRPRHHQGHRHPNSTLIRNELADAMGGKKVHLANGDSTIDSCKRNKLNLTIDTSGRNGNNGYFYDPIYEYLMSSPVMKKLKELGFQYPAFPADGCNKESKRVKVLYVVIALLLLTVLALILLNVFVPKLLNHPPPASQVPSANTTTESSSIYPMISDHGQFIDQTVRTSTEGFAGSTSIGNSTTSVRGPSVVVDGSSTDGPPTVVPAVPPTVGDTVPNSTVGVESIWTTPPIVPPTAHQTPIASVPSVESGENATGFPQPNDAQFRANESTIEEAAGGIAENSTSISWPSTIAFNAATDEAAATNASATMSHAPSTLAPTASTVTSLFPISYPPDFKCPEDQFKCRSGVSRMPCLYQWERCDGIADCSDGSDEEQCDTIKCFGNFQCGDKSCVALAKVCNGIFDCPDGSDELKCDKFKCQSYEYRCPSGYCIPKEWVCDGEADCPGHFDEYNCSATCSASHFRCPEGWCIPSAWRCNGVRDCAGGLDEENCECPKAEQMKCASGGGRCVDKERLCDGVPDCPDSSDEWNCVLLQGDTPMVRDQSTDEMLPICSQDWSPQDADMACKQFGYEKADRFWETSFQADENRTEIFVKTDQSQTLSFSIGDRVQFLVKKKPISACATKKAVALTCQKFDCGHWPVDPADMNENRVKRMVGGRTSKEHEWPSVAVLYHPQKKWACTASVIAPYWLITSALCVRRTDASPIDWKVIAGNADPSEIDPDRQVSRSIVRFVQHPSYKLILTLLADFDVMLVQLSSPLPLSSITPIAAGAGAPPITASPALSLIAAICMPERLTPPGTRCVTAGWGYTNPGGYFINKQLKHLAIGIWPKEVCNSTAHYPGLLSERTICGSNDRDDWGPCFNDEGSPLMCQYPGAPDRWYLAGVLTAQSCGSAVKHPAIYADVYSMRHWINGVIGKPVING